LSPALQLVPLLEPIREDLERVDGQLYKTVAEAGEPLSSRLLALLSPGKRLRPALVILTGQVFGAGGSPFQCLAAAAIP
jgi:geranylgeranyl pyrophosphate synthase